MPDGANSGIKNAKPISSISHNSVSNRPQLLLVFVALLPVHVFQKCMLNVLLEGCRRQRCHVKHGAFSLRQDPRETSSIHFCVVLLQRIPRREIIIGIIVFPRDNLSIRGNKESIRVISRRIVRLITRRNIVIQIRIIERG